MPHIVHSNEQNNNNNNNINIQPMKVMMDANWKWEASVAPRWTSSFLGTNDVFGRDIDDIVNRLRTFDTKELEFVSVIGGLKYLQILGRVNFSKITFYDSNINELSKLRLVHKGIASHTYDEWITARGLIGVNSYVVKNHDSFYLPHDLYEDGVSMIATRDFRWPQSSRHLYQDPHGPDARTSPMWTLNNPILFPEYTWQPTRQEYDNVRHQILTDGIINEKFYLKLPVAIASPNRLCVVWCDGVSFPWGRVRLVSPVAMAIGFYAKFSETPDWSYNDDLDLNSQWEDAHFWWETRVRLHLRGHWNSMKHMWPPEYSSFVGTAYDYPLRHGVILEDDFVKDVGRIRLEAADTVVFHIYMGTYFGDVNKETGNVGAINCDQRLQYLARFLYMTTNEYNFKKVKRILITEYNGESNEIVENPPPCAVLKDDIMSIVNKVFDATSNFYVHDRIYYMPGEKTYNKNMMLILDNKLFDHEFSDTKNKQCDGDIQCSNTAVAGPGIMFKEFLVGRDDWIENTLGVKISDDKNDGITRALFYPKGAPVEIVNLFSGQFCQQHLILEKGMYPHMSEMALDERNHVKINQGMYPSQQSEE